MMMKQFTVRDLVLGPAVITVKMQRARSRISCKEVWCYIRAGPKLALLTACVEVNPMSLTAGV